MMGLRGRSRSHGGSTVGRRRSRLYRRGRRLRDLGGGRQGTRRLAWVEPPDVRQSHVRLDGIADGGHADLMSDFC